MGKREKREKKNEKEEKTTDFLLGDVSLWICKYGRFVVEPPA
jgi:hypothetical protein